MTAAATIAHTEPVLPPAFDLVLADSGDAFGRALAAAEGGAGAGTLVWAPAPDILDLAVVFEPEMTLRHAWPTALVTMLALSDALEALGPPEKPVTFTWPDRLEVDGGQVGGVRVAAPPGLPEDAVPDWLVAGATLRLRFPDEYDAPGRHPDRTALQEEGFGELEAPQLIESFTRHLLFRIDRWLAEGPEPMANAWLERLSDKGGEVRRGLDPATGDLLELAPGVRKPERHALGAALAVPSWSA